jgi:cell division protein FtsL
MSPTVQLTSERPSVSGVKDRRLLYDEGVAEASPRNEPASRGLSFSKRRSSTFNTMAGLFFAAVGIILYISNIIAVNRLVVEVNDLQQKYAAVMNENEILRAEVNRRSSLERIGKIATEKLGLQHPKEQPQTLEVDESLLDSK